MNQFDLSLHMSGEAEAGSGEDQPARNNLTDWNGQGAENAPIFTSFQEIYA